jgi:predicted AlkP superfamily phosphohydrolase/phosphomutase
VLDSKTPVLLIVMDSMSWPVARELLADLRKQHWVEAILPGTGGPPPPVIAAIPSVTELSRMSLLAGYLHRGDQGVEKRLFRDNPGLQRLLYYTSMSTYGKGRPPGSKWLFDAFPARICY